jgi:hypothetical protein
MDAPGAWNGDRYLAERRPKRRQRELRSHGEEPITRTRKDGFPSRGPSFLLIAKSRIAQACGADARGSSFAYTDTRWRFLPCRS